MISRPIRLERHSLGPRVHLLGRRVHEYHVGFAVLAVSPALGADDLPRFSSATVIGGIIGLWLVVKDWPDLTSSTRDKASWRLGIHRLPAGERSALVRSWRDRLAHRLGGLRQTP